MIEEIEYIQPKLQPYTLADRKLLLQGCVEVVETRPDHNVAAGVAVGEGGGNRKAGNIEPLRRRSWTGVGIAIQIRALGRRGERFAIICHVRREVHSERRPTLQRPDSSDAPFAKRCVD